MPRNLTKSDLSIEQNKDGAFFYIKPDIDLFPATNLISDQSVTFTSDYKGFYPNGTNIYYENIYVEGTKNGLSFIGGDERDVMVYDFTFFDTRSDGKFASAIYRGEAHTGDLRILRSYANGEDAPNTSGGGQPLNTDFFDNNNREHDSGSTIYFRDVTAFNFADSIFDAKSTIYISNATISDAYRLLRSYSGSTIYIVNSSINVDEGEAMAYLKGYNSKIYYYNVKWNGSSKIDYSRVQTDEIAFDKVSSTIRKNIVEMSSNPLPALSDFFAPHVDRYRAQVSVNNDGWINLNLPNGGDFATHAGDTLAKLPDLGNGVYRVRAWTVDANGVSSTRTSTDSFLVTSSSFDYVGGDKSMDPAAPWIGTAEGDRMHGAPTADDIRGGDGGDHISGNAGDDRLDGGAGDDVIVGGPGDDTIIGGAGDDWLYGDEGDDVIRPGAGSNTVDGGDGFDIIDYSDLSAVSGGYVIDMAAGVLKRKSTGAVIDRFVKIEGVIASDNGDVIIGADKPLRIVGGLGADTMTGKLGTDAFVFDNSGDFGADRITDFSYSDELWFTNYVDLGPDKVYKMDADGTFEVSLESGGTRGLETGRGLRWIEYEGVNKEGFHVYTLRSSWDAPDILAATNDKATSGADRLEGGSGNDVLNGLGGDDTLIGLGGDDYLDGGSGDDLLIGGAGDDTLYGRDGDDIIRPGTGSNVVDGGNGFDTIDFSDMPSRSGGYRISLAAGELRDAGSRTLLDRFKGIEAARASEHGDVMIGADRPDRFYGGKGADSFTGALGADVFVFDNRADFGADVITDLKYNDALWFTRYIDLGRDKVFDMDGSGVFEVTLGTGGVRDLKTGRPDRWIEYEGENDAGYHVYSLLSFWDKPDILGPVNTPDSGSDAAPDMAGQTSTVLVRVAGDGTTDARPEFNVIVDGAVRETFAVISPATSRADRVYDDFTVSVDGSAPRSVAVQFLNDGADGGVNRNVYVDYIEVNGARYESEISGEFVRASGAVVGPTGALYHNGTLTFDDLAMI